ncbi:MAG: hypothetical protein OHK0021_03570 [Bryobacter sp.]
MSVATVWLAASALAQHIRVKSEPQRDFAQYSTYQFAPGIITGRHPKLDEKALSASIEERIAGGARRAGLRRVDSQASSAADLKITFFLRINEDTKRSRFRTEEVTRYSLEIRIIDRSQKEIWVGTGSGEVEDRRHRFVEPPILRAATLTMAKFPPKQ